MVDHLLYLDNIIKDMKLENIDISKVSINFNKAKIENNEIIKLFNNKVYDLIKFGNLCKKIPYLELTTINMNYNSYNNLLITTFIKEIYNDKDIVNKLQHNDINFNTNNDIVKNIITNWNTINKNDQTNIFENINYLLVLCDKFTINSEIMVKTSYITKKLNNI